MAGILEGTRVVDMSHAAAMPSAAAVLADWGAEVIKVEPPAGDLLRGVKKSLGVERQIKLGSGEVDFIVELQNRNKKGFAIDLKKDTGREVLYQLIKTSDVFMSNYEQSALISLKMDYDNLSQVNPRIIYAIITGYGTVGPDKDERGFDLAASWARSGMQYLTGDVNSTPPSMRAAVMDRMTGVCAVAGISAALLHREKTGEGQKVECSLYHTGVWAMATDIEAALVGRPMPKFDRANAQNPLWNAYRARDDRWFQLVMLQADNHWPHLCRLMEKPELENDSRFNSMEAREQNCEELVRIMDDVFATRNLAEWERLFRENYCIYSRIQTAVDVTTDPQALANDFFPEIEHPVAGRFKYVATPVTFRQNPATVRTPAPQVGQHTEELLLELDYTWDDIIRFKDEGVIP